MRKDLVAALTAAANAPGTGLAQAALVIARIEYPKLDVEAYLAKLDAMGELARRGIPITLSVVYMEIASRAGVQIDGVNFPGHFLVRCPDVERRGSGLIIDPFHGGALLSEHDCRLLLQRHVGSEVAFNKSLLAPTTRMQIIARMLLNLKRIYVHMRSFPQARDVTELLLAVTPSALSELRDRGLLAYHLNDVSGALRDLQTYLKLASWSELDKETREEHEQIWEHVKTLRRRVAGLN
jgi:regulator of sirC expression with transglutaminase-like and TPR domain